ncbi:hypothetical protein BCV71DRAFT_278714 [Rhizopus microsporus]|uniref:NAD(P)-binding protein n=1 Tax=Rhizopus microsporus TaxID=58291 RepID=A0A1X0RMI4_RHIZD|nr:hypothetical protein BCV71DRAFT_278714 [Rhizopus microsporus]
MASSVETPNIEKKKPKYILITHGDSYLGHALAIYLTEQIYKHDTKKHWFEVDYESQPMIREAMKGHVKTMIFNPFTHDDRLIMQALNVLEAAREEIIPFTIMISSFEFNTFGKWIIFRVPFIQQYLHFWSKMVEDRRILGMPISQTDSLETVHIKDICACVAQAALSKMSMAWGAKYPQKRVYELRSVPSFTLYNMAKSLSESLKEDGQAPEIHSAVVTEEQMEHYLKVLASGSSVTNMHRILGSMSLGVCIDSYKPGILYSVYHGVGRIIFSAALKEEDDPRWYPCPAEVLTPFCIQLIMDHFKTARNPEWSPVVDNPTDIRDLTGNDPIPVSRFFMNNRRHFRGSQ